MADIRLASPETWGRILVGDKRLPGVIEDLIKAKAGKYWEAKLRWKRKDKGANMDIKGWGKRKLPTIYIRPHPIHPPPPPLPRSLSLTYCSFFMLFIISILCLALASACNTAVSGALPQCDTDSSLPTLSSPFGLYGKKSQYRKRKRGKGGRREGAKRIKEHTPVASVEKHSPSVFLSNLLNSRS